MMEMACPTVKAVRFFPLLAARRRYPALKQAFFVLDAAHAASTMALLSHLFPGVTLPLFRLPHFVVTRTDACPKRNTGI